jgi:hypothetical protein
VTGDCVTAAVRTEGTSTVDGRLADAHALATRAAFRTGVILLLVAAVVRVALLPTARFGGDEALFFRIGIDIVDGRQWPLLGTQITDGAARLPGPAFLYLLAVPLWLWRAPEAQYLFVELLGAITVVVHWQALRRPLGERVAFATALLVACSPWSALYADRTWNPNVLPFFVTVGMLAAVRIREEPTSRWGIAFFPVLAVMPQLHMAAPVAWAGLVVVAGRAVGRMPRRHLLAGLALAALLYVPLAIHELQTGFENLRHIAAETVGRQGGERHPWGFVWVPVYAFRFLTLDVSYHELSGYWGGPDEARCWHVLWHGSPARPFHLLRALALVASAMLAAAGVIVAVVDARRHRWVGILASAFVVALIANTLLMALTAKQVFGHYVTNLFPFVVVVWAAGLRRWFARAFLPAAACVVALGVGGIEATWSVSRNVDAKIGLAVHRCVGAELVRVAVAEGTPPGPVRLEFRGMRSSTYDWQVFLQHALSSPLRLDPRAKALRFALQPSSGSRPADATGDGVDCGAARLWRLR